VVVGSIIVWFDVASVETVASGNGQRTNWNDEERESKREKKANKNDKSIFALPYVFTVKWVYLHLTVFAGEQSQTTKLWSARRQSSSLSL
jgi:hypothetical protein